MVVIMLSISGCAAGFGRDDAVTAYMAAHPEASTVEAECVIDGLIARYETEPVDEGDLAGLEAQLNAVEPSPDFEVAQFRAAFDCGLTDDVRSQLEGELLARGESPDDARCIADALVAQLDDGDLDVLLTGAITDEFFARFFDATASCDALP